MAHIKGALHDRSAADGLMSKTGGGVGTNQYRTRGNAVTSIGPPAFVVPAPPAPAIHTMPWEDPEVISYLAEHQFDLADMIKDRTRAIRMLVEAMHDGNSSQVLRAMVMAGDDRTVDFLAAHEQCPPDLVHQMTIEPMFNTWTTPPGMRNAQCPDRTWAALADNIHSSTRAWVARVDHCPPTLLHKLANDIHSHVRFTALGNPHCPKQTLRDGVVDVATASAVAANPNADEVAIRKAAHYKESEMYLAKRVDAPPDLLTKLARQLRHHDALVGNDATPAAAILQIIAHHEFDTERADAIIKLPHCDSQCLEALARYNSPRTRVAAASHLDCPKPIMEHLAKSSRWDIQNALATNPNLPESAMARLIASAHGTIRQKILTHSRLPDHIRAVATLASH